MGAVKAHSSSCLTRRDPSFGRRKKENGLLQQQENFPISLKRDSSHPTGLKATNNSDEKQPSVPCVNAETFCIAATPSNILIWGTILQQPFKVLVDTGAAVCVVNEQFYRDVLRTKPRITQSNVIDSIKTANGDIVSVVGAISFSVKFGNIDYECNAVILPNLAYNIVLGRDFLQSHRAVIDVGNEKVTFSENNTVTFTTGNSPPVISEVQTAKTFVIDGSSEVIIPAILTSFPSEPVIGLIEGSPKLSDRYHLLCASTLCQPDADGKSLSVC